MFVLRGVMVGLGFFGVLYCLLSLLTVCLWQTARPLWRTSSFGRARLLFGLRIAPLAAATFTTLAFALPAFFLLEGGMDEDVGTLLFSMGTVLLLAAGLFRVVTAQNAATRTVEKWLKGARPLDAGTIAPTLQAKPGLPPLLLYGISTHKVLVSETAVARLTSDELRVAVKHEMGHVRSRDNLKKLILHAAAFPGMGSLEQAWQEASEFAADESAVSNSNDAINLAAALVKLGELVPVHDSPAFTTGLVNLTPLVGMRVRRLLAWSEINSHSVQLRWWGIVPAALVVLLYTAANYSSALLVTHRVTEWFIH